MRPVNSMGIMIAILLLIPHFGIADYYNPYNSVLLIDDIYSDEVELDAFQSKLIMITKLNEEVTGFAVSINDQSIYSKISIAELTGFVFHGNKSKIHQVLEEEPRNQLIFIKESQTSSIKLNISSMVSEVLNFTITIKSSYYKIDNLDQIISTMYSVVGDDHLCCGDNLGHDFYGASARVAISLFNSMNTSVELNISSQYNFETVEINASSNIFTHFILPDIDYFEKNYNGERQSWLSEIYVSNIGGGRVNITYNMDGEDRGTINPNYVSPGFAGYTSLEIWIRIIAFSLVIILIVIVIMYLIVKRVSFFKGEKLKN